MSISPDEHGKVSTMEEQRKLVSPNDHSKVLSLDEHRKVVSLDEHRKVVVKITEYYLTRGNASYQYCVNRDGSIHDRRAVGSDSIMDAINEFENDVIPPGVVTAFCDEGQAKEFRQLLCDYHRIVKLDRFFRAADAVEKSLARLMLDAVDLYETDYDGAPLNAKIKSDAYKRIETLVKEARSYLD